MLKFIFTLQRALYQLVRLCWQGDFYLDACACCRTHSKMEISFTGKRALVTGGGRGIGRCIAKALVDSGAEVVVFERNQADLDSLKDEVPAIQAVCVDVTDISGVRRSVETLGDVHLLVNNAGTGIMEHFLEVEPESFDKVYSLNVKGSLFVAQAVARQMVAGGFPGAIVNVSSVAGMRATPNGAVYCSSKAALDHLTRVMALELGPHKVRVNSVSPYATLTPALLGYAGEEGLKQLAAKIPLGRVAETKDVANAVLFLLSDQASMIHGAVVPVDGGSLVQ